ncbi:protein disulfide-isomerase precursor, putative [Candida dubliniensis CD36]|uniref:Protein disulfide-isomerase, putative n=1 Tax=Candida dubliniensis (strain CD36 / ATCC MYA-646 / CBS 7987 / NCPF 3949 / NRRL Y-17841) TaxID=573826 RepID=B9WD83_CANDC|nr:protein disulfide-isomerase precursor, putative [Candida dubliniensis CD36]CAX42633.1 protein disulfide-isomerase precursor, putative [Candida dubliniensis CD36]
MKLLSTTLLLYFFSTSLVLSYTTSNIIQANDNNLQSLIKTPGKFSFVDFYADWCRHCKKISPIIDELSELFIDYPEIQIIKINGDKDGKKMSKKYVDIGYPTLLFFYDDGEKKIEFDGIRDLNSLSNFIQQLSGIRLKNESEKGAVNNIEEKESSSNVNGVVEQTNNKLIELTPDNFDEKISQSPISIVSFGASWCKYCQELDPALDKLANEVYIRDIDDNKIMIGHLIIDQYKDNSIDERYNIQDLPTVLFFRRNGNGDDDLQTPLVYKGKKNFYNLLNDINKFTGLNRDSQGNLNNDAGIIKEISQLIKNFNSDDHDHNDDGDELEIYDQLEKFKTTTTSGGGSGSGSGSSGGDDVEYYEKLINAKEYIPIELSRINNILQNDIDKLNGITIDSLTKRANILKSLL